MPLDKDNVRCLVIVPPFCDVFMPSLAAHIVEYTLAKAGIETRILYTNLIAARNVGFKLYHALASSHQWLVCERMMALALSKRNHPKAPEVSAEQIDGLIENIGEILDEHNIERQSFDLQLVLDSVNYIEAGLQEEIDAWKPDLVAFTSAFQTVTSIELLAHSIKSNVRVPPHIVVGGSNAEADMALGLQSFMTSVDHIFSGELDGQFSAYCGNPQMWEKGLTRSKGIYPPLEAHIDFSPFFEQCRQYGHPYMSDIWLPLETSRGCWFGEKSHCTFCGLNGQGMMYRAKGGETAVDEYMHYKQEYGPKGFFMVDNIIPKGFFDEFLKPISEGAAKDKPDIFYEVKANLKYDEIKIMKEAGSTAFQPGIEAISTPLLKHMKKGTSAFINLRTLFWAKQIGIKCVWNLLARFPNDKLEWYRETLEILPYIRHFQPPQQAVSKVSIDRFSPHFDRAAEFEIANLRPAPIYRSIFGESVDVEKIAYHFVADFYTEFDDQICELLNSEIARWSAVWKKRTPSVEAFVLDDGRAIVVDTRNTINDSEVVIDDIGALAFLAGADVQSPDAVEWLIERGFALRIEGRLVNLIERVHQGDHTLDLPFLIERATAKVFDDGTNVLELQ